MGIFKRKEIDEEVVFDYLRSKKGIEVAMKSIFNVDVSCNTIKDYYCTSYNFSLGNVITEVNFFISMSYERAKTIYKELQKKSDAYAQFKEFQQLEKTNKKGKK